MTAKEMADMTNRMRKYNTIKTRSDLENYAYVLSKGLRAIGRDELADELDALYDEMENVNTEELIQIGTFIERAE